MWSVERPTMHAKMARNPSSGIIARHESSPSQAEFVLRRLPSSLECVSLSAVFPKGSGIHLRISVLRIWKKMSKLWTETLLRL